MLTKLTSPRLVTPLLLLVMLIAAGLRFYNLNWDNGIFAHPDERSTVAFYAPTIQWPTDLATIFDPRKSTLNPFWDISNNSRRSYTYGHFPLYTLVLTAHALNALAPLGEGILPLTWLDFLNQSLSGHGYAIIGRALMALADLGTVFLIFLLGRRIYGAWGGLLAATLSTFTVLQIQLAHFFAVDPVTTTFTMLALYGSLLMYDRPSTGAAIIAGIGVGLAVASKFSAMPIVLAPITAAFLTIMRQDAPLENGTSIRNPKSPNPMGLIIIALGTAFILFAVTSPFVLLDYNNFYQAVVEEQGRMVSGEADFPFTRQFRGTLPYIYFLDQQLRWGMGWPLGLLAFVGTAWVMVKAIRLKAEPGEWLALGWIIFYFGPTGLFLAKFIRYMLPIVPLLTLFGAGLIVELWRFAKTNHSLVLRFATALLTIVVVGGSMIWSLAFVNGVYGTDHTWVIFARWTYANVPDGACIAFEHWDDRMPTDLPIPNGSPGAHSYNQPQLPMYEEDTPQKYELLRNTLMNCDYITLATNRLWRTIPRLPERYPMSSRYYQALFSGELGFEQVYAAETPPRLGRLVIDDQSADESFTVYDHPKPIMFKKTRQLSPAEWDNLLGNKWQTARPGYVGEQTLLTRLRTMQNEPTAPAPDEKPKKSLLLDKPIATLPIVNDFHWNSLANNSTVVAILWWWFMVMVIGGLAWPLTFLLFNRLGDRGYALSKSLGLLLVSYFVWLNSSVGLLQNRVSTAVIGLIILLGLSGLSARFRYAELREFFQRQGRLILATEIVFAVVYLFFITLRLKNPDLWQPWLGGEKMLEIGFLNAIVKSATMPPYDPFFAGGIINYYYYGLFIVGVLIKLTGIQPAIAFNLAVPMLAALTAINLFSLARNLAGQKTVPTALLAILFVIFCGNLEGAAQLMRNLGQLSKIGFESAVPGLSTLVNAIDGLRQIWGGEHQQLITYNFWDPTRVIPQTINEFPYFSYLFADLHPHMIGIPFTVLFLSLAYNWLADSASLAEFMSQRLPTEPANELAETSEVLETSEVYEESVKPIEEDVKPIEEDVKPIEESVKPIEEATEEDVKPIEEDVKPIDEDVKPIEEDVKPIERLLAEEGINIDDLDAANQSAKETPQSWLPPFIDPMGCAFIGTIIVNFLPRFLALPFVLGALAVINTWDLPTYLGLMLATFFITRYRSTLTIFPSKSHHSLFFSTIRDGLIFAGALLGTAYLFYYPFFAHYQALDVGLGLVHTQTPWDAHLRIWGFFLFIIVAWLWANLRQPTSRESFLRMLSLYLRRWSVWPHLSEIYNAVVKWEGSFYQLGSSGIALMVILMIGLALFGYIVPAYLLPLVVMATLLLFRHQISSEMAFVNLLAFTGLLLLLGVEFFFLRDFLGGGDYYRMNTLFKFYTQVWVIFGLATAVMITQLWQRGRHWSWGIWQSISLILLTGSLVYPILATPVRLDDRFPGPRPPTNTLDGLAYMTVGQFEWPAGSTIQLKYDYQAIRWLQDNVVGTPIIAEAKVGYYREGGMRVAGYTGLPSILGGLHQGEQRYPAQVGERDGPVTEFWTNPDPNRTWQIIQQLKIDYIYIGQVERVTHGVTVGDKFEQLTQQGMLEVVFANEQTKIYRRKM